MKNKVKFIVLGIRFQQSFGVLDKAGQIVDYLIRTESSPFTNEFFPMIYETEQRGKILSNKKTGETLTVDAENIILRLAVKNYDEDFKNIKDSILPFFKKSVFSQFEIKNINRVGLVFEHKLTKINAIEKLIGSLTDNEIKNPTDLTLRLSQRIASSDSIIKDKIVDYYNAIFTYQKQPDGEAAALDYQMYFEPEIGSINDVPFDDFFKKAETYLAQKFDKWISNKEE
jgi:hypothetical protein